jgi:hypothetical protein
MPDRGLGREGFSFRGRRSSGVEGATSATLPLALPLALLLGSGLRQLGKPGKVASTYLCQEKLMGTMMMA